MLTFDFIDDKVLQKFYNMGKVVETEDAQTSEQ
jgi:hypothetical protein